VAQSSGDLRTRRGGQHIQDNSECAHEHNQWVSEAGRGRGQRTSQHLADQRFRGDEDL